MRLGLKAWFINSAVLLIMMLMNISCLKLSNYNPNSGCNPADLFVTSDPGKIAVHYRHFSWEHIAPVSWTNFFELL